ncbi:unnamed protein product [Haemonchus placei]|uniref:CHK kinase-like domain-containing protein n=1 Tax=Haemonchus placei TaxID=6290 RepID=A0A3P8BE27_HAEPC|nr:unnamed protein product [Haemonchus placei]
MKTSCALNVAKNPQYALNNFKIIAIPFAVRILFNAAPQKAHKIFLERITLGMDKVLCHGDLWSMNVLWRQNGCDLEMAAVIDYQTAHFGCAATDLVRLLCACLSGRDRRTNWEHLLEEFYLNLKGEVGNRKMPYTLEQVRSLWMPLKQCLKLNISTCIQWRSKVFGQMLHQPYFSVVTPFLVDLIMRNFYIWSVGVL